MGGEKRCGRGWLRRQTEYAFTLQAIVTLVAGPVTKVLAAPADWAPVLVSYHSQLTMQSSFSTDGTKTETGSNNTSSRQAFRESLGVSTVSYVYHPDLLLIGLSGSTGLDQSKVFPQDSMNDGWRRGGVESYDLEGIVLRKKPYTLNFFSRQNKPFNSSLTERNTEVTQESGAEFNYNDRVYRLRTKYMRTNRDADQQRNMIDDYDLYGTFFKPKLGKLDDFMTTVLGRYQTNVNTTKLGDGRDSSTQNGGVTNRFRYQIFDFTTSLNTYTATFDSPNADGSQGDADSISISEYISADLPWNLYTTLGGSVDTQNYSNSTSSRSLSSSADAEQYSFSLSHKLYDSLMTRLAVNSRKTDSSRVDSQPDKTGNVVELAPQLGVDTQDQFSLGTRYQKKLPLDSRLTAELSTRSMDTVREGTSSVSRVFPGVQDAEGGSCPAPPSQLDVKNDPYYTANWCRMVDLPADVDTNSAISVDVLAHPQGCDFALKNKDLADPYCWYRLDNSNDFLLHPSSSYSKPGLTLGVISDNSGLNYLEFAKDGKYGPFTLRVTYFRKAVNAKTQTNVAGARITFFEFVSAGYQHSVTSQDGISDGRTLSPTVTYDEFSLGLTWDPFSAGASREWISAETDDTVTKLWVSYFKSKTFWGNVLSTLRMEADTAYVDSESSQGASFSSSEDGYLCMLNTGMPIPYLDAALTVLNSYSYTRGAITSLRLNADNIYESPQDFGINKQTVFSNSIGITKSFPVPWVEFVMNCYVRYLWETTSGDVSRKRSILQYGVNTGRVWRFGATSINLTAKYSSDYDEYDIDGSSSLRGSAVRRVEDSETASVMLTLIRQLF